MAGAGARLADEARQGQVPPQSGTQAELREGLDEFRRACGQHDVAGEREVGAGAGGRRR